MNNKIKPFDLCVALFLALLGAAALGITLDETPTADRSFFSFFADQGIWGLLRFLGLAVLYVYVSRSVDKRDTRCVSPTTSSPVCPNCPLLILSALFALALTNGQAFREGGSLAFWFGDGMRFALFLVRFCGLWSIAYVVCQWLTRAVQPALSRAAQDKKLPFFATKSRPLVWSMGVMLACWLPYLILYFPGIGTYDATAQMANVLGFRDYFYENLSADLRDTAILHDHHPLFTTLLIGVFVLLGKAVGSVTFGVFLYTLANAVFAVFVFATFLRKAASWGIPGGLNRFLWLAFAFFPFFPLTAVTMSPKNTLHSIALLWLLTLTFDCLRNPRAPLPLIPFLCSGILVAFAHKAGLLLFLLATVPLLLMCRKRWKQFVPILLVPLLLAGAKAALMPALHISPGDPRETMSVMFQQTARIVRDHGDDLPAHERETLNNVFDLNLLARKYRPTFADGVKNNAYRTETVTRADMRAYVRVWAKECLRYPQTAAEAFLQSAAGSFDPTQHTNWRYTTASFGTLHQMTDGTVAIRPAGRRGRLQSVFTEGLDMIPGVSLLFRGQMYVWLFLGVCGVLIARRDWRRFWLLLPLWGVLGLCVLSPAAGNLRYMLPFLICAPPVIAVAAENNEQVKTTVEIAGG